jgi:hypothetical protein
MEVPTDFAQTGWFDRGPKPGRVGPAVIAGHVDDRSGPAVFFRLAELEAGDLIEVHGEGRRGRRLRGPRDPAAPEGRVPHRDAVSTRGTPGPELRLITCSGSSSTATSAATATTRSSSPNASTDLLDHGQDERTPTGLGAPEPTERLDDVALTACGSSNLAFDSPSSSRSTALRACLEDVVGGSWNTTPFWVTMVSPTTSPVVGVDGHDADADAVLADAAPVAQQRRTDVVEQPVDVDVAGRDGSPRVTCRPRADRVAVLADQHVLGQAAGELGDLAVGGRWRCSPWTGTTYSGSTMLWNRISSSRLACPETCTGDPLWTTLQPRRERLLIERKTACSLPGMRLEARMTRSPSPTSRWRCSPAPISDRALNGSPCDPVEMTISSLRS